MTANARRISSKDLLCSAGRDNNMDKIREVELLHAIKDYIHTDIDLEELRETYDLTEAEYWWIIDELKERGKL